VRTFLYSKVNPDPSKCKILGCNKDIGNSKDYCIHHYHAIRYRNINNTFIVIMGFLHRNKDEKIAGILPEVIKMTKEPELYGHFTTTWTKSSK